jgi:hypothetical protein
LSPGPQIFKELKEKPIKFFNFCRLNESTQEESAGCSGTTHKYFPLSALHTYSSRTYLKKIGTASQDRYISKVLLKLLVLSACPLIGLEILNDFFCEIKKIYKFFPYKLYPLS